MTPPDRDALNTLQRRVLQEAIHNKLEGLLLHEPLVVGVSGGADSLTLLHVLYTLRDDEGRKLLHVAHLDHGFRGDNGVADAHFVQHTAQEWGLACSVSHFDVPAHAKRTKLSDEDAARHVRYAFLAGLAQERKATVAVAHNADDQAETVLMNILRGTGVSGLAAMRPLQELAVHPVGEGFSFENVALDASPIKVFRPLLFLWRAEVEAYCALHGLQPRTDSTNTNLHYRRNRIRHELLPLLASQYNLAVKEHLYTLSQLAAAEDELVETLVAQEWALVVQLDPAATALRFNQERFTNIPSALQYRLVRRAIGELAGTLQGITFRHIGGAAQVIRGEPTSPRAIHLPHNLLISRRDDGWAVLASRNQSEVSAPHAEHAQHWPLIQGGSTLSLPSQGSLTLSDGWVLRSSIRVAGERSEKPGELLAMFDLSELEALGPLQVRARRPGDWLRPLGMEGRKNLQDTLVDAKIPREARDHIALVTLAESSEVLWVPGPGGRRSAHAPLLAGTERVLRLEFERNP